MPDERLDSIEQGIGVPPESPAARKADEIRKAESIRHPQTGMEGEMGGSSDVDRPGDEALLDATLRRGLPDDRTSSGVAEGEGDEEGGRARRGRA